MNTVILRWNSSISSYTTGHFLFHIIQRNGHDYSDFDWSVWDHDIIHQGDRFYLLKSGLGQNGIVSSGIITSEPYEGDDWNGSGQSIFYVDYEPDVMIDPTAVQILTTEELETEIPDFNWREGHSGVVIDAEQAVNLEIVWQRFLKNSLKKPEMCAEERLFTDLKRKMIEFNNLRTKLTSENTFYVKVDRMTFFNALSTKNFFEIPLCDETYASLIETKDDGAIVMTTNKRVNGYKTLFFYNNSEFPFSLLPKRRYIHLTYGEQYAVISIRHTSDDDGYFGSTDDERFTLNSKGEFVEKTNGDCCFWDIVFEKGNVVAKGFIMKE